LEFILLTQKGMIFLPGMLRPAGNFFAGRASDGTFVQCIGAGDYPGVLTPAFVVTRLNPAGHAVATPAAPP
jgi:hypothetical protein